MQFATTSNPQINGWATVGVHKFNGNRSYIFDIHIKFWLLSKWCQKNDDWQTVLVNVILMEYVVPDVCALAYEKNTNKDISFDISDFLKEYLATLQLLLLWYYVWFICVKQCNYDDSTHLLYIFIYSPHSNRCAIYIYDSNEPCR